MAVPSTLSPTETDQHCSAAISTGLGAQDASTTALIKMEGDDRIRASSQNALLSASGRYWNVGLALNSKHFLPLILGAKGNGGKRTLLFGLRYHSYEAAD